MSLPAFQEIQAILEKHGIGSYMVVLIDPDSDMVVHQWDGNEAEIKLQCDLTSAEILKTRLAKRMDL
ncbi:MAG: hypothetical protein KGL39_34930 [Patescibacteria group bacterium]|nr:hypothetical protein [Patescibacteria group bacterium]